MEYMANGFEFAITVMPACLLD